MKNFTAKRQRRSFWRRFIPHSVKMVSAVAAFFVLLPPFSSTVTGEAGDRQALKGIKSIGVEVEDLPHMAEKLGIKQESLKTEVIAQLRRAGIDVVSTEPVKQNPSMPFLKVSLIMGYSKPNYIYAVVVGLNERVALERDPRIISYAMPWWRIIKGEHAGERDITACVQETIQYIMKEFIADYNAANQKESAPDGNTGNQGNEIPRADTP